jgi:glycosyltransferase involved in cell wall biosynthesis
MSSCVLQIDLSERIGLYKGLNGYDKVLFLLRYKGTPIGTITVPCQEGLVRPLDIRRAVESDAALSWRLSNFALMDWLKLKDDQEDHLITLTWSVVVCTRNRADLLRDCLDSLMKIRDGKGEIIIIDNAPSDDSTLELATHYPVRYLREDRAGLNWARSTGARAARGEVVIYTDDDAIVDPAWVSEILKQFRSNRVGAVTGMVMPFEIETQAQELFEIYGGLGRGFDRRVYDYTIIPPIAAGMVGSGVNMAIRRDLILAMGLFDTEMDCGTVTQSGGDTYAFYLLLAQGYQIIYTPKAFVWHRHRRDYASLRNTLMGYNIGVLAFLTRCLLLHGEWQAPLIALSWFKNDHLKQIGRAVLRQPRRLPFDLILAQIHGFFIGSFTYFASRRLEREKRYTSGNIMETKGDRYERPLMQRRNT